MSHPVIAVAVSREDPLPGAAWVRDLRRSGFTVRYPPEAETWLLQQQLGEDPPLATAGDAQSAWINGAHLLLLPEVVPDLFPLCQAAIAAGISLAAPPTPAAERHLPGAFFALPPAPDAGAVQAILELIARDPAQQEAVLRRAAAQARRLVRRLSATPGSTAPPTPSLAVTSAPYRPVLMPAEIMQGGGFPPLPRPGVTVIVPTRGGPRVARCVRALRAAAEGLALQLVLVATGGLAGSLPPCDDVVRCEPPFSWAKANNTGLQVARHPLVLFLNDDCYFLVRGDLRRLVDRLVTCGHLMAVAPRGAGFPPQWDQYQLPAGTGLRPTRHTVSGACFMVRREAFSVVGNFDERFATYGCDEIDWFYRARAVGYRWAIDTDVTVDHERKATFGPHVENQLRESIALFRELHGVSPNDGPHWELTRPAVSWVIASRDGAGYLARSLGSIAAHRERYPEDAEIILALDGSQDASVEVAHAWNASLETPMALRVYAFPEPAGTVSAAKNRALRLACGDVQLCMDDDDQVAAPRAELLPLLEGDVEVAVGNFTVIGIDGSVGHRSPAPLSLERVLSPDAVNWGLWATAIRRETWERYGLLRDDLPCTGDLELWARWLRDGVRFAQAEVTVHLNLARQHSVCHRNPIRPMRAAIQQAYWVGRGTPPLGLQGLEAASTAHDSHSCQGESYPSLRSAASASHPRPPLPLPPHLASQRRGEFLRLVEIYRRLAPRAVLKIGSDRGGTLWHWLDHALPGTRVVSVDRPRRDEDYHELFHTWVRPGVELHCLPGDSHAPETRAEVERLLPQVDFLFLDGDHSLAGARQDWEQYGALVRPGGVIALHDIVPTQPGSPIETFRLWEELRSGPYRTAELIDTPAQAAYGIGVVYV